VNIEGIILVKSYTNTYSCFMGFKFL